MEHNQKRLQPTIDRGVPRRPEQQWRSVQRQTVAPAYNHWCQERSTSRDADDVCTRRGTLARHRLQRGRAIPSCLVLQPGGPPASHRRSRERHLRCHRHCDGRRGTATAMDHNSRTASLFRRASGKNNAPDSSDCAGTQRWVKTGSCHQEFVLKGVHPARLLSF